MRESFRFRMPASHPCLPGHFPGRPIVPGVCLIDAVAMWCAQQHGLRLARIDSAKFLHPLDPETEAEMEITWQEHAARVEVRTDQHRIANLSLRFVAQHD
jgi:3-hydroxyacyl-[acyl-carrier-protein] dehydratase